MGKVYQVIVYGLRGETCTVDLCTTEEEMQKMTVLMMKKKIETKVQIPVNTEEVMLKFADKTLEKDSNLLSTYGIKHMSTIVMMLYLPGGLKA